MDFFGGKKGSHETKEKIYRNIGKEWKQEKKNGALKYREKEWFKYIIYIHEYVITQILYLISICKKLKIKIQN